jgi:hypothetical protein
MSAAYPAVAVVDEGQMWMRCQRTRAAQCCVGNEHMRCRESPSFGGVLPSTDARTRHHQGNITMILEVAILNIRPGESVDFERAFAEAQAIIASMPGYAPALPPHLSAYCHSSEFWL